MIASDNIRGYNDMIILSILIDDISYGYSISKQIKESTNGMYIIKETTLYSAFNRLVREEFVESIAGEESKGRKRTYYKITEKGKQYYNDCCKNWQDTKKIIEIFIKEELKC